MKNTPTTDSVVELIYLTFEVFKKDRGAIDIELVDTRRTRLSGKVLSHDQALEEKQLLIQFLDAGNEVISEELFDNPLFKSYESYSESGTIERVKGQLDRSKLLVRSKISGEVVFVRVTDKEGFEKIFEL